MVSVGDKVLIMPRMGENMAIPLGDVEVGDNVILYNLQNETKIAVPSLTFDVGFPIFATPSFQFAGFDWKLDFNFSLIPFWFALTIGSAVKIADAFYGPVGVYGSQVTLVDANFTWDGISRVFMSESPLAITNIQYDDSFMVTTEVGTTGWVMEGVGPWHYSVNREITSLLQYGNNTITIKIKDVFGGGIGLGGWEQNPWYFVCVV